MAAPLRAGLSAVSPPSSGDAIVGGDGIQYETAGALGKREKIFITAKLPDYIKVGNDDLIEKYLFLTTSHDGSGSITTA